MVEVEDAPETQGQYVTTHLIVRKEFLQKHPELVKKWVQTHVELTEWIQTHSQEARELLGNQLEKETGKKLPETVLASAWSRLQVTYDPIAVSLKQSAEHAFAAGFLGKQTPDLADIYHLDFLNEILKKLNKEPIHAT
jgi:NitT/TauT family transport system substrate-binding protein